MGKMFMFTLLMTHATGQGGPLLSISYLWGELLSNCPHKEDMHVPIAGVSWYFRFPQAILRIDCTW